MTEAATAAKLAGFFVFIAAQVDAASGRIGLDVGQ